MEIFYVLLILLVVTRAFGEIAVRLGQPALVGELLAGIALGAAIRFSPSSFPVMHAVPGNEVFTAITDLGFFFLMLMTGLEMHPKEVAEKSKGAMLIALGGLIIPLLAGFSLGWLFLPQSNVRLAQVLFIGTALAITAGSRGSQSIDGPGQTQVHCRENDRLGSDHRRYFRPSSPGRADCDDSYR